MQKFDNSNKKADAMFAVGIENTRPEQVALAVSQRLVTKRGAP